MNMDIVTNTFFEQRDSPDMRCTPSAVLTDFRSSRTETDVSNRQQTTLIRAKKSLETAQFASSCVHTNNPFGDFWGKVWDWHLSLPHWCHKLWSYNEGFQVGVKYFLHWSVLTGVPSFVCQRLFSTVQPQSFNSFVLRIATFQCPEWSEAKWLWRPTTMTFYAFLQKTMTTPSRRLTGDPDRFKKVRKIRIKS